MRSSVLCRVLILFYSLLHKGYMRGCDDHVNVILEKCREKINADSGGMTFVTMGLYIVRGENIAIIGEIDTEKNTKIDWSGISASTLPPLVL